MNKDPIYRQLYWFLTREPSVKLAIVAAIGVALLFGCMVFYAVLSAAFSPSSSSYREQGPSNTLPTSVQLPPTFTPVSVSSGLVRSQEQNTTRINAEPAAAVHSSIDSLTRGIVGGGLKRGTLHTELYYRDLNGDFYPEQRTGYNVDFVVTSPNSWSRSELLLLAYTLTDQFYNNFKDIRPMFLSLHIRAYEGDVIGGCVLGLGIGHQAVSRYLPARRPADLERWFAALRSARYYGDLPGETDALLAYGNDPAAAANCNLSNWRR